MGHYASEIERCKNCGRWYASDNCIWCDKVEIKGVNSMKTTSKEEWIGLVYKCIIDRWEPASRTGDLRGTCALCDRAGEIEDSLNRTTNHDLRDPENNIVGWCEHCPIYKKTGFADCNTTPYYDFNRRDSLTSRKAAAEEEVKFLYSVIDFIREEM